jgi:hypothetical protein
LDLIPNRVQNDELLGGEREGERPPEFHSCDGLSTPRPTPDLLAQHALKLRPPRGLDLIPVA